MLCGPRKVEPDFLLSLPPTYLHIGQTNGTYMYIADGELEAYDVGDLQ